MSPPGALDVVRCDPADIRESRASYLATMAAQVVHDSWHARGLVDSFAIRVGGALAGHGAVGGAPPGPREVVKELHLLAPWRERSSEAFRRLVATSGARALEAQTNDALLSAMLREHAMDVTEAALLFAEGHTTSLPSNGARLARLDDAARARVFAHEVEPVGDWALDLGGDPIATGGFLTHYNRPYADLYMEVATPYRRSGHGSYLVQELKRLCRLAGHVPAARCGPGNVASARTLERAGLVRCGSILRGRLVPGLTQGDAAAV